MELFIKASQFLLSLSLLIILHELGHFIPAKLFKTKVEKFYLFFDYKFSLLKKKIGETEYGIGWLPLGGYVKIAGMIDESMDKEQMALPPQPWEFRTKPAWQRLIIMLGGVTVNFILAFFIYIGMTYVYGESFIAIKDLKDGLAIENPVMIKAGFKTGDKILAVDGEKIIRFDNNINQKIIMGKEILVERNGAEMMIKIPLDFVDQLSKQEKSPLVDIRIPFVIGALMPESLNSSLKPKDRITAINNLNVSYLDEIKPILEANKNKKIQLTLIRDDKNIIVPATISNDGKLGVQLGGLTNESLAKLGFYKVTKQNYGFFESIPLGIVKGKNQIAGYWKQLKMIFNPETKAYKQVGGFAAIFNIFPSSWSWETFWNITALLSIMLAVMNLLPIPALDGGHVVFLLYEIISGKKPSDKFLENAQMVGFVLLISLLLFANGNDIYKAVFK
jgi:regulator of sigma E protease